jgi:hypothetical protein
MAAATAATTPSALRCSAAAAAAAASAASAAVAAAASASRVAFLAWRTSTSCCGGVRLSICEAALQCSYLRQQRRALVPLLELQPRVRLRLLRAHALGRVARCALGRYVRRPRLLRRRFGTLSAWRSFRYCTARDRKLARMCEMNLRPELNLS